MKKNNVLFLLTLLLTAIHQPTNAAESPHWGYEQQIGPTQWANINPEYSQCKSGKNQTPINITQSYATTHKHPIQIEYKLAPQDIVFNGHTIQVNTKDHDEDDFIRIDGEKFVLQQFHFHTPSENQIEGRSFPLELHFVNASVEGDLAVLAVMFNLGKANPEWDKFWQDLSPIPEHKSQLTQDIDLEKLMPKNQHYYRFSGSLTTPPCTEGVIWLVMKNSMTISQQQLEQFKQLLKQQPNNRPIQPKYGRLIIED